MTSHALCSAMESDARGKYRPATCKHLLEEQNGEGISQAWHIKSACWAGGGLREQPPHKRTAKRGYEQRRDIPSFQKRVHAINQGRARGCRVSTKALQGAGWYQPRPCSWLHGSHRAARHSCMPTQSWGSRALLWRYRGPVHCARAACVVGRQSVMPENVCA